MTLPPSRPSSAARFLGIHLFSSMQHTPEPQVPEARSGAPSGHRATGQPAREAGADAVASPTRHRDAGRIERGPFVPLLLVGIAVIAWFGLQNWLLLQDRDSLRSTHASQQQTVDNAARLRQSLDAVAADTQRLANAGNPNARLLVEELRRRGITINPTAAATPAAR